MRRTLILALFFFLFLALGGWGLMQLWHKSVPSSTQQADEETLETRRDQPTYDDCKQACNRLLICKNDLAGPECVKSCREDWSQDIAMCVQMASCGDVEVCFEHSTDIACDEVCAKAEMCGLLLPEENCPSLCGEQWDRDLRECLLETPCDQMEAICLPAIEDEQCTSFCDRLSLCGLIEGEDMAGCVESCLEIDDPLLRECADNVACEMIDEICISDNYDPMCLAACDRLDRCGALGAIDAVDCPLTCINEWDDLMLACLMEESCTDLGPVCLEQPEPICEDVCRHLIDCGLEDEYDDCTLACTTNLEDELKECILTSECDVIDTDCFGVPTDLCDLVCKKAINCQLEESYEECYAACLDSQDQELVNCILSFDCPQIQTQCLQPAPQ